MKVLFLTKYSPLGASSRYRTFQHLPGLRSEGIECEVEALFDDDYLEARFGEGEHSRLWPALQALLRRLTSLARARHFDLVVLEKELFPYLPGPLERLLLLLAPAYTLDFDDALFHIYDDHRRGLVRRLLGHKFEPLLRGASLVTVGNDYLAEHCGALCSRVEHLPTVLDLGRYPSPAPGKKDSSGFTVGWIGTPVSAANLEVVSGPLRSFFESRPGGRLLLIGAGHGVELPGVPVEVVPWSEESELELLTSIDVGIMPLQDRPLERGKSGLKLLQYMAVGRPVIASPVGVNEHIVTPEVGYLAGSGSAWVAALEELFESPHLRARLGAAGRVRVEEHYSLETWTRRYAHFLQEAAA